MKLKSVLIGVLLVFLLSLPGIWDLFKPGYFSSHDGIGHVIRMEEFHQAFSDGQIPVRWAPRLYFGYGYPFFNFNYPFVYYVGEALMRVGYDATNAMKGELILAFIASGILMFLYLRKKLSLPTAILGAVLFMYAPYRMSNIYVRGSVAEASAFIFPPLLMWLAENLSENKRKSILWTSLILGLMGISHNISALLLYGFFFFYLAFLSLGQKSLWPLVRGAVSFIIGLALAAFFFVPALLEKKYTFLDQTIAKDFPDHFVFPIQLLQNNWGFGGSSKGHGDGMTFNLGWIHAALYVLSAFATILVVIKKKLSPNFVTLAFCLLVVPLAIFFMLDMSRTFWDHLPLLPFVQFPWRFTVMTVPALAVGGAMGAEIFLGLFSFTRPPLARLGAAFLIGLAIFHFASNQWHRNQTIGVDSITTDALEGSTTWADEQATKWLWPKPNTIPPQKVESINGKPEINIKSWKTGNHNYELRTTNSLTVVEHTMYYPGWKVYIDKTEIPVDYQDKNYPGQLVFKVPPGSSLINSKFTETPLRSVVDLISLISLGLVIIFLFIPRNIFRFKHFN